jgi:hypothetical protein
MFQYTIALDGIWIQRPHECMKKYYRQKHTACKTTRGKGLHEENIIKTNAHCLQHN